MFDHPQHSAQMNDGTDQHCIQKNHEGNDCHPPSTLHNHFFPKIVASYGSRQYFHPADRAHSQLWDTVSFHVPYGPEQQIWDSELAVTWEACAIEKQFFSFSPCQNSDQ